MELRPILSALLRNKTGPVLVAVQVALSLAILANALHIVQVRQVTASRPSGIAAESDVFALQVRHIKAGSHNEQLALQRSEAATLRAVAGVLSVAGTSQMPLAQSGSYSSLASKRGQITDSGEAAMFVTPDSLVKTWGLQLTEGRDFRPEEAPEVDTNVSNEFPKVVIVTRALAEKVWPGEASAIGKTLFFGTDAKADEARVIGVVERLQTPSAQVGPEGAISAIIPMRWSGNNDEAFTVRAEPGQLDRVMKETEAALRAASPTSIIVRTRSMVEMRRERYRADNGLSWMLVAVSVLLLLITASGIVGMASLWVTQRRKQIGVRRALGARRIDILRYFITENILITSAGVVAGVLLALALNQLLVSKLEMARLPAGYLLAGAGIFWALGIAAVYGPAWRAATISPAMATRSA